MAQPTGQEQEMLELLNRMRMNPSGELNRLINSSDANVNFAIKYFKVDLNVLTNQWKTLLPVQPIAWSEQMHNAAAGHNNLMIKYNTQAHTLPGEPNFAQRLTNAGYNWSTAGENIFASVTSPFYGHAAFAIDWGATPTGIQNGVGHRVNMMNNSFREVGIAVTPDNIINSVGPLLVTQDFGNRSVLNNKGWLLGVAFQDLDKDTFYDAGEGVGGVTVKVNSVNNPQLTTSVNTWSAGGYQVLLDPGTYDVQFLKNGSLVKSQRVNITNQNLKVDLNLNSAPTQENITGTDFQDNLVGGNGNDTINGLDGNDNISASLGNDSILGGGGNDLVNSGDGNDIIRSGYGDDTLSAGNGDDRILARFGNNLVLGGNGDDVAIAGNGDDTLIGGGEKDRLMGGNGNDSLIGVDSNEVNPGVEEIDILTGGGDKDTFVLGNAGKVYYNDGVVNTIGTKDFALIKDFSSAEGDVIQLEGNISDYRLGNSPVDWVSGTSIFHNGNEVIGIIEDVTNLNLNSTSFRFV